MKNRILIVVAIVIIALATGAYFLLARQKGFQFEPNLPYASTSADVVQGKETILSLEDGAQLIVPAQALTGNARVTFERNPQKISAFAKLGEGDTPLSEFYDFNVEGADLQSMVELVIPVNIAKIPDDQDDGFAVAMIPTESGWEYSPVTIRGDKAVYTTDEEIDPVIVWRFSDFCTSKNGQDGDSEFCNNYKEELAKRVICSPRIPVTMLPLKQGGFTIVGRLEPADVKYFGFIPRNPAKQQTVTIRINQQSPYHASMKKYEVVTGTEGDFSLTVLMTDPDSELHYGENHLRVSASCDAWPGEVSVYSLGWASNYLYQETGQGEQTPPEPTLEPIPPSNNPLLVQVPNLIGLNTLDAAIKLVNIGIAGTQTGGKSPYEVGIIFKQDPPAGTLIDPYQTVVLLYVTTEQSSPASLMQSFMFAHYDCEQYIRYNEMDGKRKEGCGELSVEYRNVGGNLSVLSRSVSGKETNYSRDDKITNPMPERPISEPYMHSRHYWWLPSIRENYTIPGNSSVMAEGTYTSTHTDSVYQPSGNTTITVGGVSFNAVIYTSEFEWTSNNDNINNTGTFIHRTYHIKIVDYFASQSGMLLRSEYYKTVIACETNDATTWTACANGTYTGTEHVLIYQLTATDLPIEE